MRKYVLFILFSFFAVYISSAQEIIDKPVAIVKLIRTEVISYKKFYKTVQLLEQQAGQKMTMDEKLILLDSMVYEILIMQAAEKEGINYSPDKIKQMALNNIMAQYGVQITEDQLRQMVEQQGIDFNQYIDYMKRQVVVDTYIRQKKQNLFEGIPKPSDAEIQIFYDNNAAQFLNPEIIKFSHIYYNTTKATPEERKTIQMHADETYKKIKNGASFDDMVKAEITDPNSPIPNGDLGYVARGSQELVYIFGEDFATKLFTYKVGNIALLQSKIGYHIIKITDYRQKKFLDLNDPISPADNMTVKEYISNTLYMNKQQAAYQQAYQEIVEELKGTAEIQIFKENL